MKWINSKLTGDLTARLKRHKREMNISRLQPPHPKKKKKTKRINRFQIYILSSPNAKYWSMQWISQLYSGYMQHDWIHSHTALIGIRNDCLFKAAWPLTGPQNMDRFDWISSTASLNRNDCLFEAAGPLTVTIWRSLFFDTITVTACVFWLDCLLHPHQHVSDGSQRHIRMHCMTL